MERLQTEPQVIGVATDIYEQVLISIGSNARGAVLKGIIPRDERKVSDLLDSVKQGSADALEQTSSTDKPEGPSAHPRQDSDPDSLDALQQRRAAMPPIILGTEMANELGAKVGSTVLVRSEERRVGKECRAGGSP